MASNSGRLKALALKTARPGKHFDGGGLFLHVMPNGSRYWRVKYRYLGREKLLALGVFPEVSLAEARRLLEVTRTHLRNGNDPTALKHRKKVESQTAAAHSFESVAIRWLGRQQHVAEVTANKNRWLLETFLFPEIGSRPIADVTPRELLSALRKIEATGKLETASRAKNKAGQVFRFAIVEGLAEIDPTASLRGALKSPKVKHHAAITDPKRIGELLRSIEGYGGQHVTACALKLAALLFVRPGELRNAEWHEFDLDAGMWRIPATRMKKGGSLGPALQTVHCDPE